MKKRKNMGLYQTANGYNLGPYNLLERKDLTGLKVKHRALLVRLLTSGYEWATVPDLTLVPEDLDCLVFSVDVDAMTQKDLLDQVMDYLDSTKSVPIKTFLTADDDDK